MDTTHDSKLKKRILNKAGAKRKHSTEESLEMNDKTPKLQKKINENKKHKRQKNRHKATRTHRLTYNINPT